MAGVGTGCLSHGSGMKSPHLSCDSSGQRAQPLSPPIIGPRADHVLRRKPAIPFSCRLSRCPGLAISCQRRRAGFVAEDALALAPEGQTRSHTPRRHRRGPTCRPTRIDGHHNGDKSRKRSTKSTLSTPFFPPPPRKVVAGEWAGRDRQKYARGIASGTHPIV
jgi:hypothetical protein